MTLPPLSPSPCLLARPTPHAPLRPSLSGRLPAPLLSFNPPLERGRRLQTQLLSVHLVSCRLARPSHPEHVKAHTWPQRNPNLAMTRRHRTHSLIQAANSQKRDGTRHHSSHHAHQTTQNAEGGGGGARQKTPRMPSQSSAGDTLAPALPGHMDQQLPRQRTHAPHHAMPTAASTHWRGPRDPSRRSKPKHKHIRTGGTPPRGRTYMHVHAHAHAATRPPGHQKWHF